MRDNFGDVFRQRTEHGRAGNDNFLTDTDKKLRVHIQKRVEHFKVLHDDTPTLFDGCLHGFGQYMDLRKSRLKPHVDMIGMRRIKALVFIHAEKGQRTHIDAAVIVAQETCLLPACFSRSLLHR